MKSLLRKEIAFSIMQKNSGYSGLSLTLNILSCIIKKALTTENEKSFVEELKCELVWDTMFTN